ncbi:MULTISPECIES: helix-turn-helix transcriptional regulator [Methylorubrum]|uniref:helix-turn-helix transcriptional regulator n=1 Tax=Methylorubrum TaxID=2282523 RepID=UPI00209CFEC0|nr:MULTISPECIES: helix-turn-helix transcriptional regulator [Methylorubrum]MCP1547258.1 DNA-binding XRE family transcriptional regulator [Methylorubrum zatmanii]MCP1556126.1 DNA-binding XRE family transcriptional regulator [Methylorubrum extorquens]MCP1577561.1 DNA-binding XRE family transcriptional regulator [Methylorubrum extorquens]
MTQKLKQYRVRAGLTQAALAKLVGVTQPTYQRWEAGSATVPDDKLATLAKVLETSPDALLARHAPIEVDPVGFGGDPTLSHYGEVAVHFHGGGKPLLLSISDDAFSRLHRDLQHSAVFVTVQSLTNETVAIRKAAIADLTFSSEAYDYFGLKGEDYPRFTDERIADPRDWEIIAALALDEDALKEYEERDVERVCAMVSASETYLEAQIAEGRFPAEDIEACRAQAKERSKHLLSKAIDTIWQLSSGSLRKARDVDPEDLYGAFYPLFEFGEDVPDDEMLRLEAEGAHRIYFINPATLDFVSMPTHAYQEGEATSAAEALDAYAEADDVPTQSVENGDDPKPKKRAATKQNPARRRVRRRS